MLFSVGVAAGGGFLTGVFLVVVGTIALEIAVFWMLTKLFFKDLIEEADRLELHPFLTLIPGVWNYVVGRASGSGKFAFWMVSTGVIMALAVASYTTGFGDVFYGNEALRLVIALLHIPLVGVQIWATGYTERISLWSQIAHSVLTLLVLDELLKLVLI